MAIGAGFVAAQKYEAADIVDPRPAATGSILAVFEKFTHLGKVLPAMGYYPEQIAELERTIAGTEVDTVIIGTPIDLTRVVKIDKPMARVRYELKDMGDASLRTLVLGFLKEKKLAK